MPELITPGEVAKRLCVSAATVKRFIETGKLVPYKIGRQNRFDRAEVDAFIATRRDESRAAR